MSRVFDIIQCKTSIAFTNKDSSVIYLTTHSCCAIMKSGYEIGIDGGLVAIDV